MIEQLRTWNKIFVKACLPEPVEGSKDMLNKDSALWLSNQNHRVSLITLREHFESLSVTPHSVTLQCDASDSRSFDNIHH